MFQVENQWQDGVMQTPYREILLPSPALFGFGVVISTVLGVAISYALSPVAGASIGIFLLLFTVVSMINSIKIIKVTDQLIIGKYRLPINLISSKSVLTHEQFRGQFKSNQLVLGSNSAANYLKIEIADQDDPYQIWYVATKQPNKLLAAIS